MRQPGIEPGSTAWKAAMLTTIPLTLDEESQCIHNHNEYTELKDLNLSLSRVVRFL